MSRANRLQQALFHRIHHFTRERFADPPGAPPLASRNARFAARPAAARLSPPRLAGLHILTFATLILFLIASFAPARAQNAVLGRGDAVVTGFSGIKPGEAPLAPGANPLDEFFIDLDGPSAQILSLAAPGQPGQLASLPAKLQIKARQVGQVFAIALDDGRGGQTPNIYLGATSAFGLQIVLPDADGDGAPERVKKGHPNAAWMAGQFGEGGGPGTIWKVDGMTGAVSLFATLPDNSGAGVGDVVFDAATRQFFASDLDTGMIYRLSETGEVIDSFDHGVAGRPAKGLAPVNDDGSELDIKAAAFDSENPDTWGYTPEERRVHGLAVQGGRVYYAVDGQVWSVGVSQSGFGDARWELDAGEELAGDGPVTDMLFDSQGRLYLAQRGEPRGSYDYSVFADAEKSTVVRYRREEPDNPATESVWVEEPEAYSIGLPPEHNQADGGVAIGYAHDQNGLLRYDSCGQTLWSTGHRLRPGTDDAETPENDVHGLQGNGIELVRPQNTPPEQSWFADYDGLFGDAAKSGHMGDVEIWQPCDNAAGYTPPGIGSLPPGILPPGDVPPELPPDFPGGDYHANLKLTKRATPKVCAEWFGGWLCRYTVRVRNTGPDDYFGPIMVRDWLPATPAGAVMGFAPTPPWTCWANGPSDHSCIRWGTFLAPGWSVDLTAFAWVPKSYKPCHLVNAARIQWAPPGSQWNSNPFDDLDFASAIIPSKECDPVGKKTDLKIYKEAIGDCFEHGGGIRCGYHVRVENQGPGAYVGNIVIEDTIPNGATATMSGAGWTTPCPNAGPVYTCTFPGANLPIPGSATNPLIVRVDLPIGLARQLGCKVRNRAEIIFAPGGSDQNTDPTNDKASAVATVPAKICDDKPRRSNLKIVKTSPEDGACLVQSGDWCRGFQIKVTNTGPNQFNGKIKVTDILPAGVTVSGIGGVGWTCMGTTCETNNAVTLDKNPPSADEILLGISVEGSAATARELNCKLTNKVKIDSPLGAPKNIIAADDQDQITVNLPAKFCHTPPQTNLMLEKAVDANGCLRGNGISYCYYNITVTNTGPGGYNDKIVVEDKIPGGMTAIFNGGPDGWSCVQAGQTFTCTRPAGPLNVNQKSIFSGQINVPDNLAKRLNCRVKNQAEITYAAGGSPTNTNAGDDAAEAIADLPPELCHTPVPQCPPGFVWNGERCERPDPQCQRGWTPTPVRGECCPPGAVWNPRTRQCGGDTPPPPPPPPSHCEAGWTPTPIRDVCCPPGKPWNARTRECGRDVPPPPQKCPEGWRGTFPDCWKPENPPQQCNKTARCLNGLTWSMEQCKCVCPRGTLFKNGRCGADEPECPRGTVGTPPNCRTIPSVCPRGTIGTPPNCRPRVCPPGTRGNFPLCRKIPVDPPRVCPRGTIGTPPNCRPRICPPGTRGVFPACRRIVVDPPRKCPAGTVGRFPNCRPIVRVCPKGTVGRPPNCRRLVAPPRGINFPGRPGLRIPQRQNTPQRFVPRPFGRGTSLR